MTIRETPHLKSSFMEKYQPYGYRQLYNRYGKVGEIGTVVHCAEYGYGTIVDDEGLIKWRNTRLLHKNTKPYVVSFDRIITPQFTKDVTALQGYNYDIRDIMSVNSLKDSEYRIPFTMITSG